MDTTILVIGLIGIAPSAAALAFLCWYASGEKLKDHERRQRRAGRCF